MQIQIKNGFDIPVEAGPGAAIAEDKSPTHCAIMARDFPGVNFRLMVEEGARVRAGQALLCDRRRPQISFTSPCDGVVTAVNRGARRRLVSIEISNEGSSNGIRHEIPESFNRGKIIELMLESGLWSAVRSRPYDRIPDPDSSPEALMVTAIDTRPHAPNPTVILFRYSREFSAGLSLLNDLVDVPVYLCKPVSQNIECENAEHIREVEFSGPHPAGLVGTHISALCPIRFDGNQVWHIGYQDVISLGYLALSGKPWYQRVISLAGNGVLNPRLITVPLGSALADIVVGESRNPVSRGLISGSMIDGYDAVGYEAYLGRYHNQVTLLDEPATRAPRGWLGRFFHSDGLLYPDPLIALPDIDRVAPRGVEAVPFLRALIAGDIERAHDLGALELVEDDLALINYCCTSKTDYGRLLRNMLEQIEREGLVVC